VLPLEELDDTVSPLELEVATVECFPELVGGAESPPPEQPASAAADAPVASAMANKEFPKEKRRVRITCTPIGVA
jgi:hypothetical protein